ncbi:MAG TPA: hypothetical protein VKZ49_01410 [Polyangiaceae bacterium]|nr:hypothetical protein [Polyangiaceae bacterium]
MTFGRRQALLLPVLISAAACSTGEGQGEVTSERLYVDRCWNGEFDLDPDFFGANPFTPARGATELMIRVQRGDNIEEVSDGLFVLVKDVEAIRADLLGSALPIGLPPGVSPPGVPDPLVLDPPLVSMSLYLNRTCHAVNATLYAIEGTITFSSLFSGDRNEQDADDRLTEASFQATFADPRQLTADGAVPADQGSLVEGWFRFYFQRGQPAQPFP